MQAYVLTSYSGPDGLTRTDVPEPECDDGHLLVDVAAIGVNFPDLLMTRGLYQHRPELPVVPGCEVAGTVSRAPDGSGFRVGDRVAAFVWDGGFAERARVPLGSAAKVPDDLGLEAAAAMMVNYQTVHFALDRRGRLEPGERVLALGAAGGIGTAAVQVARGLGAHVTAGVANQEQVAVAAAAGADEVVVLEPGFASSVREAAGGPIDVVVDPLGDWVFDEALRTLGPEGRLLVIGFAAGGIPSVKVNRLLLRNAAVVGVAWGAFLDLDPGLIARQGEVLAQLAREGHVRPVLDDVVTFDELPGTLDRLGRGEIRGKAVARVGRS